VGTCYKQKGREQAILLGFDLTGSKWSGFIKEALKIAPEKKNSGTLLAGRYA
jgi:tRNA 2-selenouridine synthase